MTASSPPLRVAIVGAGPSGLYAAKALLGDPRLDVRVTMIDQAQVPWGLVRTGVAPDHQSTKNATRQFHQTISDPRFRLLLNVAIGDDLEHADVLAHHHAVLYATGASVGRPLVLPGEPLNGVHDAIGFVGWYNGDPRHRNLEVDLSTDHAVILGNGNVAFDIARVLTTDPDVLAKTDIADHALAALRKSAVREVTVVGRRGPEHAAFTTSELIGLMNVPDLSLATNVGAAIPPGADQLSEFKLSLLRQLGDVHADAGRRITLRFAEVAHGINGDKTIRSITLNTQTGETNTIETGLLIKSVGAVSVAVPGVPFSETTGTIPNKLGRVIDIEGEIIQGVYVAGWCKRGSSGVIGTNKRCAAETVSHILHDHSVGSLSCLGTRSGFDALIADRALDPISTADWWRIDWHEVDAGGGIRPRRKLVQRDDFIAAARAATA